MNTLRLRKFVYPLQCQTRKVASTMVRLSLACFSSVMFDLCVLLQCLYPHSQVIGKERGKGYSFSWHKFFLATHVFLILGWKEHSHTDQGVLVSNHAKSCPRLSLLFVEFVSMSEFMSCVQGYVCVHTQLLLFFLLSSTKEELKLKCDLPYLNNTKHFAGDFRCWSTSWGLSSY